MKTSPYQNCKFCNQAVNLDEEGTQYRDGSCAHEGCHDGNEFRVANEPDMDSDNMSHGYLRRLLGVEY